MRLLTVQTVEIDLAEDFSIITAIAIGAFSRFESRMIEILQMH